MDLNQEDGVHHDPAPGEGGEGGEQEGEEEEDAMSEVEDVTLDLNPVETGKESPTFASLTNAGENKLKNLVLIN